jgi:hypothetical protein
MNAELIAELILIGLKRLAELNEALTRMRAGGPEVSAAEVTAAGLEADAAILKARQQVND